MWVVAFGIAVRQSVGIVNDDRIGGRYRRRTSAPSPICAPRSPQRMGSVNLIDIAGASLDGC
jgi:hypothetical protein